MKLSIGMRLRSMAIAFLVLFVFAGSAHSSKSDDEAPAPAKEILDINHLLGGQYGPWGAVYQVRAAHRFRFFDEDANLLWREAFIGVGMTAALSPSFFAYGPSVSLAPLTILRVDFEFYHVIMGVAGKSYGILDYNELGQFHDYSYEFRMDNGDEYGHRTAKTWAFSIRPSLRFKAKWFILLYRGRFVYYRPGDFKGLFFNYMVGMVTSHKSWSLVHDVLLLAEITSLEKHGTAFRLGVNSNLINILPDGETALEKSKQWRIGPMIAWTIQDSIAGGAIQNPTILAMFHWYAFDAIADPDKKRSIAAILSLTFNTDWYASAGQ